MWNLFTFWVLRFFFFVIVEILFYQRKLDFQHSFKDNIKPEVYKKRFIQLVQQIDPLNVF